MEAQERLESIEFKLASLARALAADESGHEVAVAVDALRCATRTRRRRFRNASDDAAAQIGAKSVEFKKRPGGVVSARIDSGKWIDLPPALARLLRILTRVAATEPDGFNSWQTFEDVSKYLGNSDSSTLSRHAVIQRVHRLRTLMARAGTNAGLIEVDKDRGLRFRGTHGSRFSAKPALGRERLDASL